MRIRRSLVLFLEPRPPEPGPEPEPEPAPAVAPLVLRDTTPRTWNLWDLERLAEKMNGDAAAEERTLLLVHVREFVRVRRHSFLNHVKTWSVDERPSFTDLAPDKRVSRGLAHRRGSF